MAWEVPKPGQVIRYSYLWAREFDQGRREGAKDRPCAVVAAHEIVAGRLFLYVLPVTSRNPGNPEDAMEIPPKTKGWLGLDRDDSWIILTEANLFEWATSPDIRVVPGTDSPIYNYLSPKQIATLEKKVEARRQQKTIRPILRR